MNKPLKILLGIATIWPVIYMLLFFVTFFSVLILPRLRPEQSSATPFPIEFENLIVPHVLTMVLVFGLMAFYVVRIVKSNEFDQTMKIIWTVMICMAGVFAMPVFWYLHVWRERPAASEA